ncbi:hypothetical protein SRHO_G00317560 [Serrasalmus rhombeus]
MKSMCQWLIIGLSNTSPAPAELSLSSVPPQCQPCYGRLASLQERRQLKHLRQADETLPLKAAEKETCVLHDTLQAWGPTTLHSSRYFLPKTCDAAHEGLDKYRDQVCWHMDDNKTSMN